MMLRSVTLVLLLPLIALIDSCQSRQEMRACPVTQAPPTPFVPPQPFPSQLPSGFYWGTPALWTHILTQPYKGLPISNGRYRVKWPWYAAGLTSAEQQNPSISISGRRLDAGAPPLEIEGPSPGMLPGSFRSALIFPSSGCWEITAKRGGNQLTFVIFVKN